MFPGDFALVIKTDQWPWRRTGGSEKNLSITIHIEVPDPNESA
jgi:hypothetical protein